MHPENNNDNNNSKVLAQIQCLHTFNFAKIAIYVWNILTVQYNLCFVENYSENQCQYPIMGMVCSPTHA